MARYTTEAEVKTLCRYASASKIGIVEIGLLDGETTLSMSNYSNCPIYGIDPIIPDSMDQNLIGCRDKIIKNMSNYSDFKFFDDYSYNVVKKFQYKFDFIFIDGDHRYESVKKDFLDWFPLLEKGGYIAFHDSGPVTSVSSDFKGWEGCVNLVKEIKNKLYFTDQINWIEDIDTLNIFKKI